MSLNIDKTHPCSNEIYTPCSNRKIEYIVIHFTGDGNVPAKNYAKCNQYNNAHRDASWHYIVGNKTENYKIYQSVADKDIAWHCGANKYRHPKCRNNNSIGIEHCCYWQNGKAYFEEGTIEKSIELVVALMSKYKIPISNVIRHYDVTGKNCPQPFLYNDGQWEKYLFKIKEKVTNPNNKIENVSIKENKKLAEAVSKLIKKGCAIDYNQWKREDLFPMKHSRLLFEKIFKVLFKVNTYKEGIDYLVKNKIINTPNIWYDERALAQPKYISALLIKLSEIE